MAVSIKVSISADGREGGVDLNHLVGHVEEEVCKLERHAKARCDQVSVKRGPPPGQAAWVVELPRGVVGAYARGLAFAVNDLIKANANGGGVTGTVEVEDVVLSLPTTQAEIGRRLKAA